LHDITSDIRWGGDFLPLFGSRGTYLGYVGLFFAKHVNKVKTQRGHDNFFLKLVLLCKPINTAKIFRFRLENCLRKKSFQIEAVHTEKNGNFNSRNFFLAR